MTQAPPSANPPGGNPGEETRGETAGDCGLEAAGAPRLALFGGSFDPVHRGHLEMAKAAREVAGLERVLFVPCWRSPFKEGTAAGARERVEMLRLALAEEFGGLAGTEETEGAFRISTWEIERPRPSYSWETVRHFRRLHPGAEWHWILGGDQWEALPGWAEPERLRRDLRFVVLHRGSRIPEPRPGWRAVFVPFDHPASSSAIRADFAAGREWLPTSVAEYCEREGLYG